jgi:NAD(P)-dependent dehydrogenase (short-subunit alcohol dehydrogenase family)
LLGDPSTWLSHCNPDNLLTTLMLSTFVGMCLPGKHATFIDFQISFQKTNTLTKDLKLAGTIAFKSISTSTIVENIVINEIDSEEASCATAKLTVKVNKPKVAMPLISEIAEKDFDLNLKSKTVLITGGSGGIGQTIAKYLALHGSRIALHYYRGKDEAERVVSEINDNGGQAKAFPANVCDRKQVRTMIANTARQFGNIDILVNNAVRDFYPKSFLELKWDDFQNELDVTLKGAFNCCQEVIPIMIKNQGGKIINISTIATETPPADQAKYVAAKSALIGLTRSLAVEFAQNNIQVNMIVPSIVKTDLTKHVSDLFFEDMKRNIPMKRIAKSNDIAKAVIFLSSSLSSYTTGQKIMVTGGIPPFL